MKQKLLRDAFWIWGHDAGAHHSGEAAGLYHIQGTNRMGPWEAAEYLGIPNCCRVVFMPPTWTNHQMSYPPAATGD